jgi:hypothetical protein
LKSLVQLASAILKKSDDSIIVAERCKKRQIDTGTGTRS